MNTFEYIYDSPIRDYRDINRRHHPHLKTCWTLDESKVVQIVDAKGNIRYRVCFSSTQLPDGTLGFKTQVFLCYPDDASSNSAPVMNVPDEGYEIDYHKALHDFDTCVQRFDSLVKAETQDFRDIELYKDRIGYETLRPKCCLFCKWCEQRHDGHCGVLECHNPENQQKFSYMVDYPPFVKHRHVHGWQKLPWQPSTVPDSVCKDYYGHNKMNEIFPRVEPLGTCPMYAEHDKPPCP